MTTVYLFGGGGDHPERAATFGRFLAASTRDGARRIAVIAVGDDPDEAQATFAETRTIFARAGAAEAELLGLFPTPARPLTADALAAGAPTGVFVCGGATPAYHAALCADRAWVGALRARGIPYGGLSAGAAIAAEAAIVGGWRARRGDRVRPILFQGASEDRDLLDVRPGLGLTPFAVEVHASQWGTLTRLLHALDLGLAAEGWAIDEGTLLAVDGASVRVHGAGQAYHVERAADGAARVTIHPAEAGGPA
jgi:cyanophycinase